MNEFDTDTDTDTGMIPAPPAAEAPVAEETAAPASTPRPRVRWAGIVWGIVLAAVAATGMVLTGSPDRLDDLVAIVPRLSATTVVAGILMTLGALALISGLVGLLRRAQRTR